ncbi:MAG: hemerythrin domain-containing protein [Polyangiaceae bacterium]|nr:hemerythrin domain-containing protein [Polyangiaceae bacterium]
MADIATDGGVTLSGRIRARHRCLQTRIATLEFDGRARHARVVQLAEELVAHATAEQLVLYPYAEELLGLHDLSFEIERALDALLGVVGGMEDDTLFGGAIARLSVVFERHVDGDELGLLPMVEALGAPDQLVRMGETIEEFERSLGTARRENPGFWSEAMAPAPGGWRN